MDHESPPQSPLSDIDSERFDYDTDDPYTGNPPSMPPAKRQKLEFDDTLSISSDSSAEVPNSPSNRFDDDDVHEQVTICTWVDCDAGDLENMDRLVEHIHNEHIDLRGKKYTCEWADCPRIGMQHASAYALKAHMRSHTREKPFYCTLPECDRAFTRSDALAKHHRTVHETEALRPSDPIPKSMSGHKSQRTKTNTKEDRSQSEGNAPGASATNGTTSGHAPGSTGWTTSYPPELGFTAEEEARGPKELYYLLRQQIEWAEEEAEDLRKQSEAMEELRKKEWMEKEILLEHVIEVDRDWQERRLLVLQGAADLPSADVIKAAALREKSGSFSAGSTGFPAPGSPVMIQPSSPSPMVKVESQRDNVEALTGMRD
ncbi:hypothetical protein LZ554_004844 [Drepanopeziza brunnea f. sp. 'monogermtubi']|nr:hypothetical protein LZ554_004844 [Drepanopeziza brunnea f. sp. 'monogermtubi']